MHFRLATLFPGLLDSALGPTTGLLGKAVAKQLVTLSYLDLRDFGGHHELDDAPYGGGSGLLLRADVAAAVAKKAKETPTRLVLLSPDGAPFSQVTARRWATLDHITLVAPRYEGLDERGRRHFDEEVSLGDFVLSGGEYAALPMIDAVARLIPGVLGNQTSTHDESFSHPGRLEPAQYTRPETVDGVAVPKTLMSGDHAAIKRWRMGSSAARTIERRLDLVAKYPLTREEQDALTWLAAREQS